MDVLWLLLTLTLCRCSASGDSAKDCGTFPVGHVFNVPLPGHVFNVPLPGHVENVPHSSVRLPSYLYPTSIQSAANRHPIYNEPATNVHPTSLTVRDHGGLWVTMSDNDDRAKGSGTARDAGRSMQVPSPGG